MKALTLKQPWADMLFCPAPWPSEQKALKELETRVWKSDYKGELLITTSLKPDKTYFPYGEWSPLACHICGRRNWKCATSDISDTLCPDCQDKRKFGHAIGVVEMVGCTPFMMVDRPRAACEWYEGYCFEFKNPRKIEPFPIKGSLSIWNADVELSDLKFIDS